MTFIAGLRQLGDLMVEEIRCYGFMLNLPLVRMGYTGIQDFFDFEQGFLAVGFVVGQAGDSADMGDAFYFDAGSAGDADVDVFAGGADTGADLVGATG